MIGEQIARHRRLRDLTQEQLAARAGVSVDVIRRLEQGQRHTARLASLSAIAEALDAELSLIIAPRHTFAPDVNHGIHAIRRALTATTTDALSDLGDPPTGVDLDQLDTSTTAAWTLWQRGSYNALGGLLPDLIMEARNATRETMQEANTRAWALLTTTYEIAAGVAIMLGYEDLAWLASERATDAATRSGDPVAAASADHWASWILRRQGRYTESQTLATRAAERHEPSLIHASPDHLAVWGGLLVNASGAAARAERATAAEDLLSVAEGAAGRLSRDRLGRWSVFGPRILAQSRVINAVETGDFDTAVHHADRVATVGGQVPASWEARYLLALAQAHSELANHTATLAALSAAVRAAPEWVRYHRLARDLTLDLVDQLPTHRYPEMEPLVRHLQLR
jgi:transcriptional regulator with XRE-family HTH domain